MKELRSYEEYLAQSNGRNGHPQEDGQRVTLLERLAKRQQTQLSTDNVPSSSETIFPYGKDQSEETTEPLTLDTLKQSFTDVLDQILSDPLQRDIVLLVNQENSIKEIARQLGNSFRKTQEIRRSGLAQVENYLEKHGIVKLRHLEEYSLKYAIKHAIQRGDLNVIKLFGDYYSTAEEVNHAKSKMGLVDPEMILKDFVPVSDLPIKREEYQFLLHNGYTQLHNKKRYIHKERYQEYLANKIDIPDGNAPLISLNLTPQERKRITRAYRKNRIHGVKKKGQLFVNPQEVQQRLEETDSYTSKELKI